MAAEALSQAMEKYTAGAMGQVAAQTLAGAGGGFFGEGFWRWSTKACRVLTVKGCRMNPGGSGGFFRPLLPNSLNHSQSGS